MKLKFLRSLNLQLLMLPMATLYAGTRTSVDYTMSADTFDSGGQRVTSILYTNDGSTELVAGISAAQAQTVMKGGFVAQLTDVTAITLTAPQSTVAEGATIQIEAFELLDDNSRSYVAPQSVSWSVLSGPLTTGSTSGLLTAAAVYQDTAATAHATHLGFQASLALTVMNTGTDDYGSYAGDGLPDTWQVQYFGTNNPKAGPNVDAAGTGQTNLFKYVAGLNPTDPTSRLAVNIQKVPGQPGQMQIVIFPVGAGSTYTVVTKSNLSDPTWAPLTSSTQSDIGQQRTVTDLSPSSTRKFYRVNISKP